MNYPKRTVGRSGVLMRMLIRTIQATKVALYCLLMSVPFSSVAQTQSVPVTEPDAPSTKAVPSSNGDLLPAVPQPSDQTAQTSETGQATGTGQQQSSPPDKTKPGAAPSLGDLGFTPQQTQADVKMQALLSKRTHMLKVHQTHT